MDKAKPKKRKLTAPQLLWAAREIVRKHSNLFYSEKDGWFILMRRGPVKNTFVGKKKAPRSILTMVKKAAGISDQDGGVPQ